jgi:D-3-phosphoglycerate dehydrogenase
MRSVVITDCDHDGIDPELRVLGEAGFDVRLERCRTSADVAEAARDADGVICQYAPVDAAALESLRRCRVVVRYGVGVDSVDVDAASRRGVWVANVPDYGTEEVADHALALLMASLRAIPRLDRAVRAGEWDVSAVRPLRRLSTLTVGVVGCGRIGEAFARKVLGAGLRVVAYDPAGVRAELREAGAREAGLDELLAVSDAVSLHLPLTDETRHLIGSDALSRMRPGAYLINTSRGGVVDHAALLAALEAGRLAGAALDVLEAEPPAAGDPLTAHPRVLVTPHAAWYSEESYETLKSEAAREVVRVLSGEPPRCPVNHPEGVGGQA